MISIINKKYFLLIFTLSLFSLFGVFKEASAITNPDGSVYCARESYWELVKTGAVTGNGDAGSGYSTLVPLHYSTDTSYDTVSPYTAGATLRFHQRVVGPDAISASAWNSSWTTQDCTTGALDGNKCSVGSEGYFWLQQVTPSDPACQLQSGIAYSPPNRIESAPLLTASCSATPNPQNVNQNVNWTATASGGTGTYSYSWSGTAITGATNTTNPGNTSSFSKLYSIASTKNATITVTSGTQTASANCSVDIQQTPPPATVSGYHDGASGTVASTQCNAFGWAVYSADTSDDLDIKILTNFSDGASEKTFLNAAGAYRGDLTGVCSSGTCAYSIDLNNQISYGSDHSITVQAKNPSTNAWVTLGTTPKTLNCTAPAPPPPPPPPPTPPTVTLTASPSTIDYGTASTLTWTTGNSPTSCTASGAWSGTKTASGGTQSTGILYSNKTYTITCSNSAGTSAPSSATVTVNPQAATTGTIVVNSNLATTWSITGPATLTQSTDLASKTYTSQPTGTYTITPATKSGYTYSVSTASSQTLSSGGTITFNVTYTQNAGAIVVNSNLATTWSITGPANLTQTTDVTTRTYTAQPTGTYTITPAAKSGYTYAVNTNPQTLTSGGTITFTITYTSTSGSIIGSHEVYSGTVTSSQCKAAGWAAYTGNTSTDLNVRVLSDGTQVATGLAYEYRGDLTGPSHCPGNVAGTCAYNVDLNNKISYGVNHVITVQAQNPVTLAWTNLNYTPQTLRCNTPNANIVVNSNLATTWSITGPATLTQSTDVTTRTYNAQLAGTYTIAPAAKSGYSYTVNTNPQTVADGGTITFTITYTSTGPSSDFTISASPDPVYAMAGFTGSIAGPSIAITPYNGLTSSVTLSVTNMPISGGSGSVSPSVISSPYGTQGVVNQSFSAPLVLGTYTVTVRGRATINSVVVDRFDTYTLIVNTTGEPPKAKGIIPPFEEF